KGQVFDSLGAVVTGATVIVVDANAKEKSVVTNKQGEFTVNGLAPGKYTVRVTAPKFGLYENSEVEIKAAEQQELTVALSIEAIREIRVNQNPFSAEYDRVGFGRVEILTKPGFDKFRGSLSMNFNDESLNSRNPFAQNRAPSQTRNFNGFLSGPIKAKKSSY